MDPQKLYETLKKLQEAKGYYFNKDKDGMVMPLMESLIANKDRYSYMACPCRLASGNYEEDKDLICPCVYREEDVKEFGTCYCGLYVSKELLDSGEEAPAIPERRPAEKVMAALLGGDLV